MKFFRVSFGGEFCAFCPTFFCTIFLLSFFARDEGYAKTRKLTPKTHPHPQNHPPAPALRQRQPFDGLTWGGGGANLPFDLGTPKPESKKTDTEIPEKVQTLADSRRSLANRRTAWPPWSRPC